MIIGVLFISCLLSGVTRCYSYKAWVTTDDLEHHISPEDLEELFKWQANVSTATATEISVPEDEDYGDQSLGEATAGADVPSTVDCFGLGTLIQKLPWLFDMKPDSVEKVNTHFYFMSRKQRNRVQVYPDEQFGLEWVDFSPRRKTVMIVHGFMSHSNASWVNDMAQAFLNWTDVNVIAVDWSGGGNTWKYLKAVANTRRVGSDVIRFFKKLVEQTGASPKDFHFIGHSLGAHICSYVSYHLGGVFRITGLDPAQPCFKTDSLVERLDATDAEFVDVIHTNGRLLSRLGFGLPEPIGHADFYPNGGMKQPGCSNRTKSFWSRIFPISLAKLQAAICNHGRAYLLFTESIINKQYSNCSFASYRWNLTFEGVNASLQGSCDRRASCSLMGIDAVGGQGHPRAKGPYFALTTEKEPYCPTEWERRNPRPDLLHDLKKGFKLAASKSPSPALPVTASYADPLESGRGINSGTTTTTCKPWYKRLFG